MNLRLSSSRPVRRGFTLVEMLAAMVILIVIIGVISTIYARFRPIWAGARKMQSTSDGNAVMEFMLKELSATLCDGKNGPLALRLNSSCKATLGLDSDCIFFISSDQRSERRSNDYRQGEQVVYALDEMKDSTGSDIPNRFRLVRYGIEDMGSSQYTCYKPTGFPKTVPTYTSWNPMVMADNVRTIEFWVFDEDGNSYPNYYSGMNGRPRWIEVYLELLGDEDAVVAAAMTGSAAKEYCDRRVQRFVGRAYLHANQGRE